MDSLRAHDLDHCPSAVPRLAAFLLQDLLGMRTENGILRTEAEDVEEEEEVLRRGNDEGGSQNATREGVAEGRRRRWQN